MSADVSQARQLFLTEALELCQQIKVELLIFTQEFDQPLLQKLIWRIEILRSGADHTNLTDIQFWAENLATLLVASAEPSDRWGMIHELLQRFCDGLQLALISHRSTLEDESGVSQREFVIYSLMPKVLEDFELILTQPFPASLQTQLIRKQIQWVQYWSSVLELTELQTVAEAALKADADFPQSSSAIAPVALAGLQVASEAILQRLMTANAAGWSSAMGDSDSHCPSRQALSLLKTGQYLLALAQQTIFCILSASIKDIAVLGQVQQSEQGTMVWQDQTLPLYALGALWDDKSQLRELSPAAMVLILDHGGQNLAVALDVDRLISEPELPLRQEESSQPRDCCYGIADYGGAAVPVVDLNWLLRERVKLSLGAVRGAAQLSRFESIERLKQGQPTLASYRPTANLPNRATQTILIVDDSKTVRAMLTLTLQEAGYSVLQAEDGQQAMEQLRQFDVHLTICDLEMSNLNGFEFLRHRLQDRQWSQIPVIILSSHTGEEYRQLSKKLGAADYFTIPYDPVALSQAVAGLIHSEKSLTLGYQRGSTTSLGESC
jgi:CheY-like chemotaxis protein